MKRKSKKQEYARLASLITGKPIPKAVRTKPATKSKVSESTVSAECKSWLKRNGVAVFRNNVGTGDLWGSGRFCQYGIKGGGDLICCANGLYIEVETKKGTGGSWSLNQQEHAEQIQRAGGLYFIVHSVSELAEKMAPYLKQGDLFDSLHESEDV